MPTYEVLVSDELLPSFSNGNPRIPAGFHIIGPADGPVGYRQHRFRVEDDNAPDWTEGKLITPEFTLDVTDSGHPTGHARVTVTAWREEDETAVRFASAVQRAEDHPGRIVEAGK